MSAFPSTVEYRPQEETGRLQNDGYNPAEPRFVPYSSAFRPVVVHQQPAAGANSGETVVPVAGRAPNDGGLGSTVTAASAPKPKTTCKTKRVFKVIIIGDAGVGKTCLSFRFCNGRFPAQTEATIGVDFRERSLIIDGELIRVQLWDTAGQERYRQSIVAHYYRNVHAVVFVYDVSNPVSFKSLSNWIGECQKHAVVSSDTPHILIGNKCDLTSESSPRVRTDEAQKFADENDMALFETSALADSEADHVESIFMTVVHKLRFSKPMHVQTSDERNEKKQWLLLKAEDVAKLQADRGWCC